MYDWAKMARILISKEVERYMGWLRERLGPVEVVLVTYGQ
jgi:hypothetical protein